jgi:hypothetical protein
VISLLMLESGLRNEGQEDLRNEESYKNIVCIVAVTREYNSIIP